MDFDYDGSGLGKGGTVTLSINGEKVGTGKLDRTQPLIFSADETAGVGQDDATPVTPDYKEHDNTFNGKVLKVAINVQEMGAAVNASGRRCPGRTSRARSGKIKSWSWGVHGASCLIPDVHPRLDRSDMPK